MKTPCRAGTAIMLVGMLAACGAGDASAPCVDPPRGPCPGLSSYAPELFGILRTGELVAIRRLIEEEAVDGGSQRRPILPELVTGILEVARRLPLDADASVEVIDLDGLRPLLPVLERVVRLALSDAEACSQAPSDRCPRLSGLVTLGRVFGSCAGSPPSAPGNLGGGASIFRGLERVVRRLAGVLDAGGGSPLRDLEALLADEQIDEFLTRIAVDDLLGRGGVALLLRKLFEALADPSFEYVEIEVLMNTLVLPLAGDFFPELVEPLENLVLLGAELLGDGEVQAALQPFFECYRRIEFPESGDGGWASGLLYDIVVAEQLGGGQGKSGGLATLVGSLSALLESGPTSAGTESLVDILDYLATSDAERDALMQVAEAAFSDARVRGIGGAVLALLDTPFLDELALLLRTIREGCQVPSACAAREAQEGRAP